MTKPKANEREVSLFRNGRSQAVRIPKEFEFETDKVIMWKDPDGTIHLQPKRKRRTPAELIDWLRAQPPLDEEVPDIEELPLDDVDLGLEP